MQRALRSHELHNLVLKVIRLNTSILSSNACDQRFLFNHVQATPNNLNLVVWWESPPKFVADLSFDGEPTTSRVRFIF